MTALENRPLRRILATLLGSCVALAAASAVAAPASHADACAVRWRTVQDRNGDQQYLKVNWCYDGTRVTSHTWVRGEATGSAMRFYSWGTSQSGGNGVSYFSITSDAWFTPDNQIFVDPQLRIDVNGQGNSAVYQPYFATTVAGN